MAWPKGKPRPPGAGRKAGTPNKASMPWKEFVTSLVLDPDIQERLKAFCLDRPELLFRAAEFAYGKPHQSMDVSMSDRKMVNWPIRVATDQDLEEQDLVEVEPEEP